MITRYEYDLKGQLIAVTDPNGNRSTRQYDKRGYVVKTTDALGNETASSYDVNGNLVSTTNAKGQTATYEVNALNQVTSTTDALGLVTSYSYDANGQLNKSVNPMGGVSTSIFDKNGNTVALTGPEGAVTAFSYDANGNLSSRSTVGGNSVKYTYNASDLVETFENARGQNIRYKYDLCGRVTESASPEGTITYTYDANGNVLTVTDKNGTITRTYDALNRVTSITDTKGYVVSYVYDAYGNLSELVYPDNTKATYTYDLCGNIKTVTDFDGNVTSYTYDALNREVRTDNANLTYVTKEYDAVSNLTRMSEYSSETGSLIAETIYEYDSDDRLLTETETVKNRCYIYTYDNLSRVIKRTTINYATGETVNEETFDYDGAGNITEAVSEGTVKSASYNTEDNRISSLNGNAFNFDDDGNLVSGIINGTQASLTYDSRNRLTGYNSDVYLYDSEDYRIESSVHTLVKEKKSTTETTKPIVNPVKPIPVPIPKSGKGEIMGEGGNSEEETSDSSLSDVPAGTSSIKSVFETDEEEPVTEEQCAEETVTEESVIEESVAEEPAEEEPESFEPSEDVSYNDVTGNDVSDEDVSENDVSGDDIFTEDVSSGDISEETLSREDLIIAEEVGELPKEETLPDAELTASSEAEEVTYVEKEVRTTYCYDRQGKNLLMTVNESGIMEKYVYGNGLISSGISVTVTRNTTLPIFGTGSSGTGKSGTNSVNLEYKVYSYDIRGSVTRVSDKKGATTAEYTYSTYGNRISEEPYDYFILGYCARDGVLTEANGLLYMRARYYSPDLMRFINEDIVTGDISNSNSLNRYSYVEGNPVTMVDPFGLEAERSGWQKVTDWFAKNYHEVCDVLGFIPVYGDCIDFCNGLTYAQEGDWVNATFSFISVLPIIGDVVGKGGKAVVKGGKALIKGIKYLFKADDYTDAARFAAKYGDDIVNAAAKYARDYAEVLAKQGGNATDIIRKNADEVASVLQKSNSISTSTFKSQYDIPINEKGFTKSSLELGQKVHKEYMSDVADGVTKIKEYVLPSGKRVDFIDFENKIVYELKPNNPNQIKKGTKQLDGYLKEIEAVFGEGWTSVLDTY